MTAVAVTELTTGTLDGSGIFDALMKANKAHLESEFKLGRIKGAEYATVYLGALQATMQASLTFLGQRHVLNLQAELLEKQIETAALQALNIPKEGLVLDAQVCKLQAEFDLLKMTTIKTETETALLTSKITTEKSQTTAMGVDADSVVGRQKALYEAQTAGFTRDAEQKAAKLMVDSWNVRRSTDEGTLANADNNLSDAAVGRAVTKLLAGVNA